MKTISTLIFMVWFQSVLFGQTNPGPAADANTGSASYCALNYGEDGWEVLHKTNDRHKCNELVLFSIPPLTQTTTPITVSPLCQAVSEPNIIIMGSYTLKKAPALEIPEGYTVIIEDLLTGQYYNLGAATPFTFSMNRASADTRFILEINKNKAGSPTAGR